MFSNVPKLLTILAATGIAGTLIPYSPESHAFDFGNMMNPSKWMGGNKDRYDDYDDGPYGGPWGQGPYGGGPYGGGPYGGGPWGGYGPGIYGPPGAYGAPGAPGYQTAPPQAPAAPAASTAKSPSQPSASRDEVDALKRRIEELEAQQQPPQTAPPPSDWKSTPPPSGNWGSAPPAAAPKKDWNAAPAFRPMGNY